MKMARMRYGEQIFKIDDKHTLICWTEGTSYGFRHLGTLFSMGAVLAQVKAVYYNRTWEKFRYATLLEQVAESYPELRAKIYSKLLKEPVPEYYKASAKKKKDVKKVL